MSQHTQPGLLKERMRATKVSPIKALLIVAAAMPFAGTMAHAQEYLTATAITPDHAAIIAAKTVEPAAIGIPTSPITPDPMISMLPPGVNGDAKYWEAMRKARASGQSTTLALGAALRQAAAADQGIDIGSAARVEPTAPNNIAFHTELEPFDGDNGTPATAERIRRLGTGKSKRNTALIFGDLPELPIRPLTQVEDDGAIPLALDSGITGGPDGISFSGVIGDGPNPGVTSDYDFVEVTIPANTTFEISVATADPFGDLDPFVTLYLPNGAIIFQQDDGGAGFDTFVTLTTGGADLNFLIAIGGFGAFEPLDPFDSSAGSITGQIGSEGAYDFQMRVFPNVSESDFFKFRMKKGDVLGAAVRVEGSPTLEIYNPSQEFEKGVQGFGSFAVPASPLPIDGSGVIDYIAEETGVYSIGISGGFGEYEMDLALYRPEFEETGRRVQLIWLDFNGGPVDKAPWFGVEFITDHTPFRGFLPAWDLPDTDEDVMRMTDAMIAGVNSNLFTQLVASEENPNTAVIVLGNDGTGVPGPLEPLIEQGSFTLLGITFEVSVVEVSGTIPESQINTIGIASTIDPGNYEVNDTALMLLDILSAPARPGISANNTFSLNDVVLAEGVTKEEMVTEVIANVTAHEAGHYLGNFHTDGFSIQKNIMDQGPGGLFNLAGIGPSGVFGAEDTIDNAFFDDEYAVSEGFQGDENTTVNTAYALTFTEKKNIKR